MTNADGGHDNDEDVINFVKATTQMFAESWYASMLGLINKLGFKTRLGMATLVRAVVWTGGNPGALINNPITADGSRGILYAARQPVPKNSSTEKQRRAILDEITANVPLGDIEKEKKFVKLWWEAHRETGKNLNLGQPRVDK